MKRLPKPIQSLSSKLLPKSDELRPNPPKTSERILQKGLNMHSKILNKRSSFSEIFNSELKMRELPNFRKNSPECIQNFVQILSQQKSLYALNEGKKFELVGRQISQNCEFSTNLLNKKNQDKKFNDRKKSEDVLNKPEVARRTSWARKTYANKRKKNMNFPLIKISSIEALKGVEGCLQDSYSISINGWDED